MLDEPENAAEVAEDMLQDGPVLSPRSQLLQRLLSNTSAQDEADKPAEVSISHAQAASIPFLSLWRVTVLLNSVSS